MSYSSPSGAAEATGIGARAACFDQALLVLRWFREDTSMPVQARDAGVPTATGYRYLHEDIDVLAAQAPEPHQVLRAGRAAGGSPVTLDGTSHRHRPLSDEGPRYQL